MKKGKIVLTLLIGTLLIIGPARAQQGQEEGTKAAEPAMEMQKGMMAGGMMGKEGMMHHREGHHGEEMHGKMGEMMGHCGCSMMGVESRMRRHFETCMRNAGELGLSEEQMTAMKSIHNEKRKQLIRLQAEIRVFHVDLKEETDKPIPDMAKVEQILRKQESLRTELALETIGTRVEVSKILTKEQFEKLLGMMKEMVEGPDGMGGM